MDFIDDEAEASSTEEVLVPSSQTDDHPRPRKRARLKGRGRDASVDEEYDLPSSEPADAAGDDEDDQLNHKSKYEARIHVPLCDDRQTDTFVTQLTQQWSSPSRIRGPRWMKPRQDFDATPSRQQTDPQSRTSEPHAQTSFQADEFEDDDDDVALLEALEAAVNAPAGGSRAEDTRQSFESNRIPPPRSSLQRTPSFRQTTLHGLHTTPQEPPRTQTQGRAHNWPLANRNEPPTHHRINRDAMGTWVYPINLGRIRDYQYTIVHKGLFHNLLVALPTGLGKTFIAATVMLNWFRWTENAQIIFVAPTKPLVSQQVDACFHIAGIPRSQTTMLTGEVPPAIRAEEWQNKRVFFMTPQTLINDLRNGMCDPKKIVLVVVDEAHKATGNYAYVEVVRFLRRFNSSFRVLALTATPGASVEAVQAVIDGLGIARVEIRTEDSLDIREFVHSRETETEIFDNSDEMTMSLKLFSAAVQPLMNKLNSQNAYWGKDPERITLYGLKMAMDQWRVSEAGRRAPAGVKGMVQGIFAVLMSMAHNLELLKYHGIGPFYHKMKVFADEASGGGKYAKQVAKDENFLKLMNRLRGWINNPEFVGHPKLSYLKTVVLNHFMDAGEGQGSATQPSSTRIMVFAHYRDSAEEIVRVLNRHGPIVRAHVFVGQSGTKGSEGMGQKTQLDIIQKFKAGTYNTIVATSIGEEGLDIGEVDLIICYDSSKSPIRMLQRMGRTGRKRAGRIVLLLMRGKEEQDYRQAKDNYQTMQDKIAKGKDFQFHEDESPRIVPKDISPVVDKRAVEIPIENTQNTPLVPNRRKARNLKKPAKKFNMPDGVQTGFTFLGKGKKTQEKVKKASPGRKIDREVAVLPPLHEVVLTAEEEEQLDLRYVRLAGLQDEFIQHIRLGAFPEQQQSLGKTNAIKHSRATTLLVKAFQAMREPGKDWERPWDYGDVEQWDRGDQSSPNVDRAKHVSEHSMKRSRGLMKPRRSEQRSRVLGNSREKTQARTRLHSAGKTSRPLPTIHSSSPTRSTLSSSRYGDNDSFIDDDDDSNDKRANHAASSSEDEPSPSLPDLSPMPEKRVFLSQQSSNYDQDFPDLEAILGDTTKSFKTAAPEIRLSTALRGNRARRVLDSDDDD
ncbi:fanconi anemia group M protein [Capronia epimyces CBS 606.96]|uniref:ATP-dependent DNA helicase n=1 Tax=Capronia epimyces CBS 606.96 TaxID=1182542 RepID=W9YGA0_9EURO|nr:fanconi anemia group M protein [Capronia epimyces CBS 606.96]EXJ91563.1 fanconi anemia group M protein [Capronia epimyces CBS 606.96]